MKKFDLTTPRLSLTPLAASDHASLHALMTSPGVRRFLWDDRFISRDETSEVLARNAELFSTRGFGVWGVREHSSHELLGFGGFWYFRNPPELELMYGVSDAHAGRGLATEIAREVMHYAVIELGWRSMRASTDYGNVASSRVLETVGFRLERRAEVEGLDTLFYVWNV